MVLELSFNLPCFLSIYKLVFHLIFLLSASSRLTVSLSLWVYSTVCVAVILLNSDGSVSKRGYHFVSK